MDSFSQITSRSKPIILVTGCRTWSSLDQHMRVCDVLDRVCFDREWIMSSPDGNWLPDIILIEGGAKGVDTLAEDWAVINWNYFLRCPANWPKHGKSAGPIRNREMLALGPDLVVGFHNNLKESKGTRDMIKISLKAGIPVEVYSERHQYTPEEIAEATS